MEENIDLNFDFDEFEHECEEFDKEMCIINAQIDNAFEWINLLTDIQESAERFNINMTSLDKAIEDQATQAGQNHFLFGTLLAGIISAYEGFIHELFNACCNKNEYITKAVSNINKLPGEDLQHLRINLKKVSAINLKSKLLSATLHNPIQIARISYEIFGLKIPTIKEDFVLKLLSIRNAFSHNNGFLDGVQTKPTYEDLKNVYNIFIYLVNGYIERITKEANIALDSTK